MSLMWVGLSTKVRKATKNGEPAKYKPEIHIETLERTAWTKGTPVSSFGKNVHYKVYMLEKLLCIRRDKHTIHTS